ncbi:hypothetical protein C8250_041710 [Streptomyces sp. So13.3]|uniref:hypothetical protein n=1 Tax=Streptomyces TaxID=1883 RepID=UPI001107393B|nr:MULTISPECIES: hypothetical protein [Streptomyces]MCZ4098559.1 hypothetical protein [Streptomyces sp. H39-C1]QNA77461.1 hypothetical protein C8250_041710 [Streptomyces sp. So13.3]
MKTSGKKKPLSEDLKVLDADLAVAADMIAGNAATSLRDGRWVDLVVDLVEANRRTQISLHEAVEKALAHGQSFESLAAGSHLSAEYLQEAYEQFDRAAVARPGPDKDGREPWRVLG